MRLYVRTETETEIIYQFPYEAIVTILGTLYLLTIALIFLWGFPAYLVAFALFFGLCVIGLSSGSMRSEALDASRKGRKVWTTGSRFSFRNPRTVHIAKGSK